MPLYVYKCVECDNESEHLVKLNESNAPTECSECSGKLVKQISLGTFTLKGDGWAKDLYASHKNEN